MSKVCQVTGKKPMFGNNVSHANNKTRRKFNVNLQKKKFWLPEENRFVTLRLSMHGLRIINKKGMKVYLQKPKNDITFELHVKI
mgnify:CR=1 FL=1